MAAPEVLELTVIRGLEPSRLADHHAPLQTAGAVIADTEAPADRAIDALPPVDTGRDAWLFLVAAFVIETTVWGLPFSVGILHQYWTTELFKDRDASSTLALAATLQTGLMYCAAVFVCPAHERYAQHRAKIQTAGLFIAASAILASAFVRQPWHLVLTLGVLYPLGAAVYYMPAATLLFQWFSTRRGLASGIMYSGTGIGGAVFPFAVQALLDHAGYRLALIALAVIFSVPGALVLRLIRPRVPVVLHVSGGSRARPLRERIWLRRSAFYAFGGAILFTSLGNFVPSVYLPAYAEALHLPSTTGTLLVSLMNAASVPGILFLGHLSDRVPLRAVVLASAMGSALACLLLWGFATRVSVLIAFAVAFGFLGLSFSGVWAALITVVAKDDPHLPSTILAIYGFARGVGNISSGPISNALLTHNQLTGAKLGYGVDDYGSLLLYTGLMMAIGSVVGTAYRDRPVATQRLRDDVVQ